MITLRLSADHDRVEPRGGDVWSTFDPDFGDGEGSVIALSEGLISPGADVPPLPLQDADVITYVLEGALAFRIATGEAGLICAGEFHRRPLAPGHREANASRSAWARLLRVSLRCAEDAQGPAYETKRFSTAERRGVLCIIASRDGRSGSLRIRSDSEVHSAILDSGRHLAYELAPDRGAWLHVVTGAVILSGVVLMTGDGAGITDEPVSLIARDDSEVLLIASPAPQNGRDRADEEL